MNCAKGLNIKRISHLRGEKSDIICFLLGLNQIQCDGRYRTQLQAKEKLHKIALFIWKIECKQENKSNKFLYLMCF